MSNDFSTPFFIDTKDSDAQLFYHSFNFYPGDVVNNDRITVPFVWYTINDFVPVLDTDGTPVSLLDRKAWILNALTGNDAEMWKKSSYVDGIIDEDATMNKYRKNPDRDIYHPSSIPWVYVGTMSRDFKGNKVDKPIPFVTPVSSPNNRVKLYDISNKNSRFPTTKMLKLSDAMVYGTYLPYKGALFIDGLTKGDKKYSNNNRIKF